MRSSLFRILCIMLTIIAFVCVPQASFAGSGHGGGFHGGGGFGGGFHGGVGGFRGVGGWRSYGGYGWHGGYGWPGYGWRGWGYPGWGYGWGWGFGVGFGWGWGWGSYWPSYPYAYGYPNYYYPYYPCYGPYNCAPQSSDRYRGGTGDPRDDSRQQNFRTRESTPHTNVVTIKAVTVPTTFPNYRTLQATGTVPRQEVRNVIQALQAMPPDARRRQIESGRYNNFSPDEMELLRRVAQTSALSAGLK